MNVSAISKALLVKSLADSAAHGVHATIPFAEAVQQLSLIAEDSGNAGNRATSDVSEDIDSLIQVAINLASSNENSQTLAGVLLLRLAIDECSRQRFLQTFPAWGIKLLGVVKAATATEVRRSVWAALRSLFLRISHMLELPALAAVPTAFRSHLKLLGQFAGEALCGEHSIAAQRAAASHCLSLLPHVTGHVEQWSNAAQNVLATAHSQLDVLYMGLEDEAAAKFYRSAMKPDAVGIQAESAAARVVQNAQMVVLARQRLAASLDCLERLLTQAAPAPVPVPAHGVVQLSTRILSVDDSLVRAGRASPSATAYTELLAVLPGMHAAAAKLLQLLLQIGGGVLVPQHKGVTRLLADLLRRLAADPLSFLATSSWLVRREVYACAAALIRVGGWGPVRDLAAPVMQCMLLELYTAPAGAVQAPKAGGKQAKKRKRSKGDQGAGDLAGISSGSALLASAHGLKAPSAAVETRNAAAQTAVLMLVEELYKVGGAILGLEARAQLDAAVAHQAATAAAGCERASRSGAQAPRWAGVVLLAALRALLASVLAPCAHRPPFIAHALHAFRQGLSSADPELRAFCAGALLSCEAFVHPRSQSPWPTVVSAAPASTGAAVASTSYLGVPRMWSAISPATLATDRKQEELQWEQGPFKEQPGAGHRSSRGYKQRQRGLHAIYRYRNRREPEF
ncbi:hypothetical protein WJX75_003282 [Coccomyxa subellipsoidea]|uniref:Ribosomal RNA-processing protein 12-like conserved domain-containing protein n=1 Tax=Coccomyxa subellipsoidea TaxID=248742 RepID=A0ABR2YVM6_9CHLO